MNNCLKCGKETKNLKFCSRSCCGKFLSNDKEFRKKLKESRKNKPFSKERCEKIKISLINFNQKKREMLIKTKGIEYLPLNSLKKEFKKEKGNKCEECKFEYTDENGKGPFEIHHIDGDHDNWKRENLRMLCLNCHWKTNNYRFKRRNHSNETKKIIGFKSIGRDLKPKTSI